MKEYFVTFCIAFFMTVFACFFNYFQSLAVSALGGLPLAAVAYWRMAVVGKAGLSITGHTVAFMLGWFLIFAAIIFPMLKSTLGSLMIYCSWGLAALLACIVLRVQAQDCSPGGCFCCGVAAVCSVGPACLGRLPEDLAEGQGRMGDAVERALTLKWLFAAARCCTCQAAVCAPI